MFYSVTFNTRISTNILSESPVFTTQTISKARITRKQRTDQSQFWDTARNHWELRWFVFGKFVAQCCMSCLQTLCR